MKVSINMDSMTTMTTVKNNDEMITSLKPANTVSMMILDG